MYQFGGCANVTPAGWALSMTPATIFLGPHLRPLGLPWALGGPRIPEAPNTATEAAAAEGTGGARSPGRTAGTGSISASADSDGQHPAPDTLDPTLSWLRRVGLSREAHSGRRSTVGSPVRTAPARRSCPRLIPRPRPIIASRPLVQLMTEPDRLYLPLEFARRPS